MTQKLANIKLHIYGNCRLHWAILEQVPAVEMYICGSYTTVSHLSITFHSYNMRHIHPSKVWPHVHVVGLGHCLSRERLIRVKKNRNTVLGTSNLAEKVWYKHWIWKVNGVTIKPWQAQQCFQDTMKPHTSLVNHWMNEKILHKNFNTKIKWLIWNQNMSHRRKEDHGEILRRRSCEKTDGWRGLGIR
jgi:hypothetical protein